MGHPGCHFDNIAHTRTRNLIPLLRTKEVIVHITNNKQTTPLHYLCQRLSALDCNEILPIIIERGAQVNHGTDSGRPHFHESDAVR